MLHYNTWDYNEFLEYFWYQKTPTIWDKKYLEKTKKYAKIFSYIPGILFIGIGNSTVMNWGSKDSDIDLFIITQKNRLWIVRILMTFLCVILWVRKTAKHHAGRFCLSFFIDESALNFEKIIEENDIYMYFWILTLTPVFDVNNTYEKFLQTNTSWANFENFQNILQNHKNSWFKKIQKNILKNTFWDFIENILKKIFLNKTLKSYEKLWKPYWIIIKRNMLKFHNNDIRRWLYKKIKNF